MSLQNIVAYFLIIISSVYVMALAAVGVIRFPDFLQGFMLLGVGETKLIDDDYSNNGVQ